MTEKFRREHVAQVLAHLTLNMPILGTWQALRFRINPHVRDTLNDTFLTRMDPAPLPLRYEEILDGTQDETTENH